MPPAAPRLCSQCKSARAVLKRPKNHDQLCRECFYSVFEEEVHQTIIGLRLFRRGERVALAASGGKDSTVLAHVVTTLNKRYDYGLDLFLLSIDEGISGYRDDSLDTVRRNEATYGIPLVVISYKQLYDWTMDEIVATIGTKNNCTFCGVFRRQALDRGAVIARADKIATGHNADDVAETVLLNILRGDVPRLGRCANAMTGEDGTGLPRVKPFKYSYEKEIVMYAYFKRLDYFSTECVYAPFAARGFARDFVKDLEAARPSAILDIIRSAEHFADALGQPHREWEQQQQQTTCNSQQQQQQSISTGASGGSCQPSCASGAKAGSCHASTRQPAMPATPLATLQAGDASCAAQTGVAGLGAATAVQDQDSAGTGPGTATATNAAATTVTATGTDTSATTVTGTGIGTAAITGTVTGGNTGSYANGAIIIRAASGAPNVGGGAAAAAGGGGGGKGSVVQQVPKQCQRCGYLTSQPICKACVLLEGLNRGRPGSSARQHTRATEEAQHRAGNGGAPGMMAPGDAPQQQGPPQALQAEAGQQQGPPQASQTEAEGEGKIVVSGTQPGVVHQGAGTASHLGDAVGGTGDGARAEAAGVSGLDQAQGSALAPGAAETTMAERPRRSRAVVIEYDG